MDRHKYLEILVEQIRAKRARPMILEEVEAHIEDQKRAFIEEGLTEAEAEEAAVLEMGDPVRAGVELDRIHKPCMEWRVLTGILVMTVLGIVLQMFVLLSSNPSGDWHAVMTLDYVGAGRHLLTIVAGIPLMLLVCMADYSILSRYAMQIWRGFLLLLILLTFFAPVVNGRTSGMLQVSFLLIPCYAGVLYHFRGQGKNGLLRSLACLMVAVIILLGDAMLKSVISIGAAGMVLLVTAIHKKWFGEKRKQLYLWLLVFLGIVFLVVVLLLLGAGYTGLEEYQKARIDVWLHPKQYADYDPIRQMLTQAGDALRQAGTYLTENMAIEIRNSYLWLYLFRHLGTGTGILLTGIVLSFWALLFAVVCRQKNQLGYMTGLGCVLFPIFQTLAYMGTNFSLLPAGSDYMPFLSNGNSYLLITYFYMGLLLSVCRNRKLVKN